MFKKQHSLGTKVTIISIILLAITVALSVTITAFMYAFNLKDVTFTLVKSGSDTIQSEVETELSSLKYLSKTVIAHGYTTDTAQRAGQNHRFSVSFCSFIRHSCPSGI